MKLSEFVASSLEEIHEGILKAKERSGVWVAPGRVADQDVWAQQQVTFDIAVTTSAEGGGHVHVGVVGVKGDTSHEATNRLRFSVPVYFEAINGVAD